MRVTYLTVLLVTTWLCGGCWKSHAIGEAGAGGAGGAEAGQGGSAASAGEAGRGARAVSGAGGETPARAGDPGSAGSQRGYCGDGIITPPEECDGLDLNGQTCSTLGQGTGQLFCLSSICRFDVSMCVSRPVNPTGPAYPDGTYYSAPETPAACMEISGFLLHTHFSYPVEYESRKCACDNCLDLYGPCLPDYDCLNVVACCMAAGKPDTGCLTDAECGPLITEWATANADALGLLTSLSDCFLSACSDTLPAP